MYVYCSVPAKNRIRNVQIVYISPATQPSHRSDKIPGTIRISTDSCSSTREITNFTGIMSDKQSYKSTLGTEINKQIRFFRVSRKYIYLFIYFSLDVNQK